MIIVTGYDRLAWSLKDLPALVERIQDQGAGFRSLAGEIDTTPPAGQLIVQVMAGPRKASAKHLERMERLASGMLAATGCRSRCPEITGPSRRGRLVGVIRRTYTLLRGDFFAFRFVSDFHARQHIDSIDQFFPD